MSGETDAELPKVSKRARWRKLETVDDVRRALAAVVKKVHDGKLNPDRGAVCVTGLRALAKVLVDSELERRLAELERRLIQ